MTRFTVRPHRGLPALAWLRTYQGAWLRGDVIAGVTLAAYLVPAAIADASLANLPPQAGLYACLFSGLVFWLLCSSRHTTITTTSAVSLVVGTSLGGIAGGDATRFGALAAGTALLVALIAFIAWLVRAGGIVTFISESVMVGFKSGAALFLASTQLPKLFGLAGGHGNFWQRGSEFFANLDETNVASLLLGLPALAILVAGKVLLKNKPVALFVVVGGIALAALTGLEARGVKLLGDVPQGLPRPGLPVIHWTDLDDLLPLALACFLLGAVETAAIGRLFAARHGGRLNANQECLALAAANLAAGLGRGFPVSGGMSQSVVNESGGARTPLSGLLASMLMLVVVLFLSGLLRGLPQPVLAAIVLAAVGGMFNAAALRHMLRTNKTEYVVAIAALLGVLATDLLQGVLIGAIISLVLLIRRASRPHVAVLGRIPGTRRFSDRDRHPDNEPIPGVAIFRPETGLVYFNVDHVCDAIRERLRADTAPATHVIVDLSATPLLDMQSAHTLADLADELKDTGVRLQVVEARSSVRDQLRTEGVDDRLGGVSRFMSVADAIDAIHGGEHRRAPPAAEPRAGC